MSKKHSLFGASVMDRREACPGSALAEDAAPEGRESEAAAEGTRAHSIMEFVLETGIKDVATFYAKTNEDVPSEMLKHVQTYVDYVRAQVKGDHYEMLVEEKISLEHIHKDVFGTGDTLVIEPFGTLEVVDFKYGAGKVVEASRDNLQLAFYALGAAHARHYDFEKIKVTIVQPRCPHKEGPIRSVEFSVEDLKEYDQRFRRIIKAALKPNAPRKRGKHCHFCRAKITCPEITRGALAEAKIAFDDGLLPDPKDLAPSMISKLLDRAEYIDLWVNDVRAYAEKRLNEGAKIPGYRLRAKRAQKKWADAKKVEALPIGKELMITELASPAQAEKILRTSGDYSDETIAAFLKKNVVSVSSGTTIDKDESGEDLLEREVFAPLIEDL